MANLFAELPRPQYLSSPEALLSRTCVVHGPPQEGYRGLGLMIRPGTRKT